MPPPAKESIPSRSSLNVDAWDVTTMIGGSSGEIVMNFAHKFQPAQNQEISIFQKCSTCPINCFVFFLI